MNSVRSAGACLSILLSLFSLGCGSSPPPTGTVSGHVKLNGADVDGGQIRFTPSTGLPVEGAINGGRYEVANVPTGDVKVSISWVKSTGKQRETYGPGSPKVDITEEAIPANYNSNTELRLTVAVGPNTKDFELKKPK